eukprot:COSAG06_NODE_23333_length_695_cov_1.030201_2_plen_161_part_00
MSMCAAHLLRAHIVKRPQVLAVAARRVHLAHRLNVVLLVHHTTRNYPPFNLRLSCCGCPELVLTTSELVLQTRNETSMCVGGSDKDRPPRGDFPSRHGPACRTRASAPAPKRTYGQPRTHAGQASGCVSCLCGVRFSCYRRLVYCTAGTACVRYQAGVSR